MVKPAWILSILAAAMIAVLFQNCGQSFSAAELNNLANSVDDPNSRPYIPVGGTPSTVTNATGAPIISVGLTDKLVYSNPTGVLLQIMVKGGPPATSFTWLINGNTYTTTVPNLVIKDLGTVAAQVTATGANGLSSVSKATLSISPFAIINGKLNLYNSGTGVYDVIFDVDLSTLKLIGLTNAVTATRIYSFNGGLRVAEVANATSAREISTTYLAIGTAVYYNGSLVVGANATSFSVLSEGYGKDSTKIYCQTQELANADLATFSVPLKGMTLFGRDKTNIYLGCTKLDNVPSSSVIIVSSDYVDPNGPATFVKAGSDYYYIGNNSALFSQPYLAKLPFIPVNEKKLKSVMNASLCCMFTDGVNFARASTVGSGGIIMDLIKNPPVGMDLDSLVHISGMVYKDKTRVIKIKSDNTWDQVGNVKADSFVGIDNYLFKDADRLYGSFLSDTQLAVLTGVNVATFKQVSANSIYKDSANVYALNFLTNPLTLSVIPNANPATFVKLAQDLYRDDGRLWVGGGSYTLQEIFGVDLNTFTYLGKNNSGTLIADASRVFVLNYNSTTKQWVVTQNAVTNPRDIKLIQGTYFSYGNSKLYYSNSFKEIAGVSPTESNIKVFPQGLNTISVGGVFIFNDKIIPGVNGNQLTALANGSYFWKDGGTVYYIYATGTTLVTTNAPNFRLINAAVSAQHATDGTKIWYTDDLIVGADFATFVVTGPLTAEDKTNTYKFEIATKK